MKHEDIWRAIDTLAAEKGLSTSGLARRAGLDATTFNQSKRRMPDGRLRWPSTESVAKILAATGETMEAFTTLVTGAPALPAAAAKDPPQTGVLQTGTLRRIPLLTLTQLQEGSDIDENGPPPRAERDETSLPDIPDSDAYGVEIAGDGFEPVYRDGATLIVSPSAPARKGDRIILRTIPGGTAPPETVLGCLNRRSARWADLAILPDTRTERSLALTEIAWMHRILWASQ